MAAKVEKTERVLLTRFQVLFRPRFQDRIQDAVLRASKCFEAALFLAKLLILQRFDTVAQLAGGGDGNPMDNFNHAAAAQISADLAIDETFFKHMLSAVTTLSLEKKKGRPFSEESRIKMAKYMDLYSEYIDLGALEDMRGKGINLSHVFGGMAAQMETAYRNNVALHFPQYLKRFIRLSVELHWLSIFDQATVAELTKEQRRVIKADGSQIIQRLLFVYVKEPKRLQPWAQEILEKTKSLIPRCTQHDKLFMHLKSSSMKPAEYLPYMIAINRFLEHHGRKTLNPTPLRTTHIPGSITLNTATMVDLVFQDKSDFDGLRVWMAREGYDLSEFKGKADLYSSVKKFLPFHGRRRSKNKKKKKNREFGLLKYGAMMFKNTVTTDGHKAGIHYVNEEAYLAGHADSKSVSNRKDFDAEFPYVTKLPEQDRTDLMDPQKCRLLFVDPGKKNILTVGTGCKGTGIIKYTMVQRRREAYFQCNQIEYNGSISRVVRDNVGNPLTFVRNTDLGDVTRVVTLETLITMGYAQDYTGSHSSSNLGRFRAYLVERHRWKHVLSNFFQNQQHRRCKYRAQLGVRSSESKLANNIQSKFKDGDRKLVLCWGNWGRTTNLKNQAPTPGVGIRRIMARYFKTATVDERYTSSVCPHCDSDVGHPLSRPTPDGGTREIHHLLRCKNETCSRWWQRDVMALANFKRQVLHGLEHGKNHPVFAPKTNTQAGGGRKRKHNE
ncbi:hypothetical protein HDU78_000299 [Chytriomyces hyalinus]|nr:hypothetical protein HDU78_000299 [Chytriomyces hyalinus]